MRIKISPFKKKKKKKLLENFVTKKGNFTEDSTTIEPYIGPPTLGYNKRGLKDNFL